MRKILLRSMMAPLLLLHKHIELRPVLLNSGTVWRLYALLERLSNSCYQQCSLCPAEECFAICDNLHQEQIVVRNSPTARDVNF